MTVFSDYQAVVARHTKELSDWVANNPTAQQALSNNVGNRTVDQYLDEYSYKFAITYYLASDIRYPQAARLWNEIEPFQAELADLMD